MRAFLIIAGLLIAALVSLTAPASAHADHDQAPTIDVADPQAHTSHPGDPDHDIDHNPADHSHPIGEDTFHEKASHSSLDFAHYQTIAVKLIGLPRAASLPFVDEAAHGLEPTPPIRPPLS